MKKTLIALAVLVTSVFCFNTNADASFLTADVFNRPTKNWGMVLKYRRTDSDPWTSHNFNFYDVDITFDTTTGDAVMQGTIIDNGSGEKWDMKSTYTGISHRPGSGGTFPSGPVPYDEMFEDMKAEGFDPTGAALFWENVDLVLNTGAADPSYQGARSLSRRGGKPRVQYQKFGPQHGDLFGMSGWITADTDINGRDLTTIGDQHFGFEEPRVPEPATMSLLAFGLSGMGFIRKKKGKGSLS